MQVIQFKRAFPLASPNFFLNFKPMTFCVAALPVMCTGTDSFPHLCPWPTLPWHLFWRHSLHWNSTANPSTTVFLAPLNHNLRFSHSKLRVPRHPNSRCGLCHLEPVSSYSSYLSYNSQSLQRIRKQQNAQLCIRSLAAVYFGSSRMELELGFIHINCLSSLKY